MSEKLYKALATAFKTNADEFVTTLKNADDEWLSDDEIITKVKSLVAEKVAAASTKARGQGQAEQNAKILKHVKGEGYENPDNLQGDELLAAFKDWQTENTPGAPPPGDAKVDEMDRKTLLKLPIVKELIQAAKQDSGKTFEALKVQFDTYKVQVEKEKEQTSHERVWEKAEKAIALAAKKGLNLKVEGDGISEDDRVRALATIIRAGKKVGLSDKGEPIFLGDDGMPEADEFGNAIPFSETVIRLGKPLFGILKQDPNHEGATIPANRANGDAGEYVPKFRFANAQEYDSRIMASVDPAERAELTKARNFHLNKDAAGK